MFSFDIGASGCFALCSSMSCDNRRAHAIPAGPPPTMVTSASITGCSTPVIGFRKTIIKDGFPPTSSQSSRTGLRFHRLRLGILLGAQEFRSRWVTGLNQKEQCSEQLTSHDTKHHAVFNDRSSVLIRIYDAKQLARSNLIQLLTI